MPSILTALFVLAAAPVSTPDDGSAPLSLPDRLDPAAIETIEASLAAVVRERDWKSVIEELSAAAETPVARFALAWAQLARGAVWQGERAEAVLDELRRGALARGDPDSRRLAAHLLLARGRGQLVLRHNRQGLATLERAAAEFKRLGDPRGRVRALAALAEGLIHQSHRPQDALGPLQELLVTANRAGMRGEEQTASRLYDEWRKRTGEVDDYFGRATRRMQEFPASIGIPQDADLVAEVDGVLVMNGDTDDQLEASPPVLVSFDGMFVRRHELPGAGLELRGSLVDDNRRLWAATNRGLLRVDREGYVLFVNPELADEEGNGLQAWLQQPSVGIEVRAAQLASNIVNEVKQGPDGRIYLTTNQGVSLFDPAAGSWEQITPRDAPIPPKVERVAPAPDGTLVAAWRDAYAVRTPEGRWKRFDFGFSPACGRPEPALFGLLVDRDGRPWVHGLGGAHCLDGHRIARTVDRCFAAVTRNVNHVLRAADGHLWFASTDGLCRQDGSHCDTLSAGRWLKAEWALDLFEWPDNHVWVTVYQGGLYRLLPPRIRRFGVPEGLRQPDNQTVAKLGEHIYLTNAEGLVRIDPGSGRIDNFVSGAEGLPRGGIEICIPTGDVLVLAGPGIRESKGLALFDGRQGRVLGPEQGLGDVRIRAMCEQEPGTMLVAARSGLWQLDTRTARARPVPAPALENEGIQDVACAPGEPVWVRTDDQVFRMEQGRIDRVTGRIGLQSRPTALLHDPEAGLFVLGERELLRRDADTWQRVDVADGFDFRVRDVARDALGRLFFSTESGVFVQGDSGWTRLGAADGLVSDTSFGMLRDADRMWITGLGGVAAWRWPVQAPPETFLRVGQDVHLVDPQGRSHRWKTASTARRAGHVRLRGLAGAFDQPEAEAGPFLTPAVSRGTGSALTPSAAAGGGGAPQVIERDTLDLQLTAAVPYMDDRPGSFIYQLRLDGGDWKHIDHKHTMTGLADGEHLVEARAIDARLQVDPTPARLHLVVDTPVSPWLLAGAGVGFGLVLFGSRRRLAWWVQRMRHRSFRPIEPSPFTPGRPAAPGMLVGRQAQLDAVQRMVQSAGGVAVAWGMRGMGKRSFMGRLADTLAGPDVLAVQVDLSVAAAGKDAGRLVDNLHQALAAELARQKIEPGPGASIDDSPANPFERLGDTLGRLERARPGQRVLLLLHNAEVLGLALEDDTGQGAYLFPFLRSMAQERAGLTVVLDMEGRWFELSRRFAQLFGFASPLALTRFSMAESLELLERALRGRVLLAEREARRLAGVAGGHPYLLHWLGDRLIARLNAEQTNVCSGRMLEEVIDATVREAGSGLQSAWLELTRVEKLAVACLAEMEPAGAETSLAQVMERLGEAGARLLDEEVRRAVLSLVRDGMLEGGGEVFRLRDDLLRHWVRRHHTVASVLDESQDFVAHYRLMDKLGSGGMGVVYKASDMVRGDLVALKLLRPELSESKRSRRRFLREARLGRGLHHPHIVRIIDYGEQGGRLYLAMELVEGRSLSDWMRGKQRYDPRQAARIGLQIASALEAVHELGIVHRDVKSDNVMLVDDGTETGAVKLMDFGLAMGKDASRMTRAGSLLGTVAYMSPEQAAGQPVDRRSDLYALGVVLYELCARRTPHRGDDAAVLHAIIYDEIKPLAEVAPGVPDDLDALVSELLDKDPDKRPATAAEVEQRLARIAAGAPTDEIALPAPRPDAAVTNAPTRAGYASRTLEAIRADSILLEALQTPTRDSVSSVAESIHDVTRLLLMRVAAMVARKSPDDDSLVECLQQVCTTLEAGRGLVVRAREGRTERVITYGSYPTPPEQDPTVSSLVEQSVELRVGTLYAPETGEPGTIGMAVCAPLWAGDTVHGAVLIERPGDGSKSFVDNDLELLVSVGYLLGLAVERERLVDELVGREKLAAVGNMLAGVAHDLRSPMTVIGGYAELLLDDGDEGQRHGCGVILRQVEEMGHMITNLLSYVRGDSSLQAVELSVGDLAGDVREVLGLQCEPRGVALEVETAGQQVVVDAARAKRIIYNLGRNALEAIGTGGCLRVELAEDAGGLAIRVADDGPGISVEIRERLFDPFVTEGKRGGTGLGLAIVKRFVEDHRGSIQVESQPGNGTTFEVRLPRVESG